MLMDVGRMKVAAATESEMSKKDNVKLKEKNTSRIASNLAFPIGRAE
jgi:hypothetical protein